VTRDDLTTAILTMDVVDELRHRDGQLAKIARQSYGHEELKARLAEIYRAQGIDVPDAILEAGIEAQRDRRFLYVAPTGYKARLARLWINRAFAGQVLAGVFLAIAALFSGYHFGWAVPAEKKAAGLVAELSSQVAMVPDRVVSLEVRFDAAQAAYRGALEAARSNPLASRLTPALVEAEAIYASLKDGIGDALARARAQGAPPTLVRVNGETRFAGAAPAWSSDRHPEEALRSHLDAQGAELGQVEQQIAGLESSTERLVWAVRTSDALENANRALLSARLAPAVDMVRAKYYAAGDAALRATKLQEANDAAIRLGRLGSDAEAVAFIASSLNDLRQTARKTGVTGDDLVEISAMEDKVASANTVETVQAAEDALKRLQIAVATLQGHYTYRVVNRKSEKSGVWRYHDSSPGARNHYLVVEALDDDGKPAILAIRNEESGETELVQVFGVRVSEEEYTRVGQDKMDNGIIDNDVVAVKKRGALSPEFKIPTAGGYITAW